MTALLEHTRDRIRAEFTTAGCDGWVWAQLTGKPSTGRGLGGTHTVPTASPQTPHLLGAACRGIDEGRVDPMSRVSVAPQDGPRGGVGFGWYTDGIELSIRDLMRQMVMVSDNVAARRLYRLLDEVAPGVVDRFIHNLGLTATTVAGSTAVISGHTVAGRPRSAEQGAGPTTAASRGRVDRVLADELDRLAARGRLTEETEQALRHFAGVLVHEPTTRVRRLAAEGRLAEVEEAVGTLYGIRPEPGTARQGSHGQRATRSG